MDQVLALFVPTPGAALWLGLVIGSLTAADFSRPFGFRNRALIALAAPAPILAHIFGFSDMPRVSAMLFAALFLATFGLAAFAGWLGTRASIPAWRPNVDHRSLTFLAALLIVLGTVVALGRLPDDAGMYTNLGAQRWAETGRLPYGDDLLKGPTSPAYGAAATYGPVLYAVHRPFQWMLGRPGNPADLNPMDRAYRRPPVLASQLTCLTFYILALACLFGIVRRQTSRSVGLLAVVLYAGSPYVMGLGGSREVITGLAFVSHIVPSALMLLAMLMLRKPVVAGALLAISAGALYYPAFVFPLWLAWYRASGVDARKFGAGFVVMGVLIAAFVVWGTEAPTWSTAVRWFLESTLEHQEGAGAYGASTFSFWGTHPWLAAFWQEPLFGTTSLFKPTFVAYLLLVAVTTVWAWRTPRSLGRLAALTAMLTAAVQLWKTHATGSYVEWYYPFLIVALLTSGANEAPDESGPDARPAH